MNQQNFDLLFKVILFGAQRTGKSSIMSSFSSSQFNSNYIPTIGVDFVCKNIQSNNKVVKLQIWDTAGQQRFMTIVTSYLKGAHVCLLVYDCQNIQSFQDVHHLSKTLQQYASQDSLKWLVANKSNQQNTKVSTQQGMQRAAQIGYQFMEVSAKNNYNIDKLFENITDQAIKKNIS